MKRKRCPSADFDLEQQQQSLFDTSVLKLQQEHMRHGVEPRLLRFVLINNALKLLQMHTLRLEEEDALGSLDYDGTSNRFFSNTFKHGHPSPTPLSPLTPVKSLKLESTFGDQSPLIAATPFQVGEDALEEEVEGEGEREGVVGEGGEGGVDDGGSGSVGTERRAVNSLATVKQSCSGVHLGKHSATPPSSEYTGETHTKRPCRPNGVTKPLTPMDPLALSESASTPPLDLTPSQDFAKVDPTIYDYDLSSGPPEAAPPPPAPPRPCTMQAIGTPVVQNGDSAHCRDAAKRLGPEGPADSGETDFLEELDHIVNLLMT